MKLRPYERNNWWIATRLACIFTLFFSTDSHAQPNLSFEIKKPKKFESRTLSSEKSGSTTFPFTKRFYNNTVSRFNYYFNANQILTGIIDSAKSMYKEDYTKLLSFYNYSLDETALGQIDTIIYKCTAGILLHDLRSDWVDKLYLLLGKAYLYRKDFDSATHIFQYINYAFAPKDNGYDLPIGSNASNTNGVFTIATREKTGLWKKVMSFPPGRNESFILQARTYIENDQLVEAASLLELIRTDPNFPPRLQTDLNEMIAYVMYKQELYGGAADHLLKALKNAANKFETARWEFLAAQLYKKANKDSLAIALFERSVQHTTDPLMEVYARLNMVSLAAGRQENALQKNLDELLKMARRDRYTVHRDIIYYTAAELELKRNNYPAAHDLLLNSLKFNENNDEQKQKSFLLLGDMNYTRKAYALSYRYYDSIQISLLKETDQQRVVERRPALKIISANQYIIGKEDSLLHLASLPEEERVLIVKKIVKQLRKERGLKDIPNEPLSFGNTLLSATSPTTDLFSAGSAEFYFLNTTLKARGLSEFKSRWGNRPNVDNWRRQNAVNSSLAGITPTAEKKESLTAKEENKELTIESVSNDIPLTDAQKNNSYSAIQKALLGNATTFQQQLEDFPSAIEMYEELLKRFPGSSEEEEIFFNLAYCHKKNGDLFKADSINTLLQKTFVGGRFAKQLTGELAKPGKKTDPAEKQYAAIYNLFLAGKFEEAKEAKLTADKQFGNSYWTPQLLYIESIYYIKQKQDSTAINRLENIVTLFDKSPLAEKAITMIDVLKRRYQIENYLTNLNVSKTEEIVSRRVDLNNAIPLVANTLMKKDTATNIPKQLPLVKKELINVSNTKTIATAAVIKKDSIASLPKAPLKNLEITNALPANTLNNTSYTFNAADTQYVVVVLNKVDPIFITESRNAFNRYNQDSYAGQMIDIYNRRINNQYQFLLIGPFVNARDAILYIDRTKPLAKSRIIPWLTPDKYSFSIISNANMTILVSKEDVEGYHAFIQKLFPDKF
ncbi:MAG: hypothetical protein Q8R50_13860 [Sediminibacterium sp.]|nr:hypothetical protein [Sediminibacterium sp.]